MPSRWFVPIPRLDPQRVKLHHVHGAFSGWFDDDERDHHRNDKPFTVSPPSLHGQRPGVELTSLTDDADERFQHRTAQRCEIRLGNQVRRVSPALAMYRRSWRDLAAAPYESQWTLDFVTPVTFRSGDRSSPLPQVPTILRGLARAWDAFANVPMPERLSPNAESAVWISDLDLVSEPVPLVVGGAANRRDIVLSGATGQITVRCDEARHLATVAPLLRLAPYAGVGSMRAKGFGVVSLRQQHDRADRILATHG